MIKINKVASISFVVSLLFIVTIYLIPFSWKVENWMGYYLDWSSVLLFLPISIVSAIWLLFQFNKKYATYKKINIIFYIFLLVNNLILFVPIKYKMAVYTPSILGCIYLATFLIVIPLFLILFYLDYKSGAKKNLITRNVAFLTAITIYILLYLYR
jgi:hypothetical protein